MKKKNHDRSPDKQGFSIALPRTLVSAIEQIAEEEQRSRNGQIEYFLARAVKDWRTAHPTSEAVMGMDVSPSRIQEAVALRTAALVAPKGRKPASA